MKVVRYPTAVDTWLGLLMGLSTGFLAIIAVLALLRGDLALAVILVCSVVAIVLVCWPTDYTLGEKELVVRSGLIRYRVPYDSIQSVEPSCSWLSSPAWSLCRVEIRYGKKSILVSPPNREKFIADLRSRLP